MNTQIKEFCYDKESIVYQKPKTITPSQDKIAIVIHLYYTDIWQEIEEYLSKLEMKYDLFISVPEGTKDDEIVQVFKSKPNAHIYMTENRGRDVLPFLQIMNIIGTNSYKYICKMHTKKTAGSDLGSVWRKLLYYDLIGSNTVVNDIVKLFDEDESIGAITGKNTILDSQRYTYGNTQKVDLLAEKTGMIYDEYYHFPAGTMFWIRPEIVEPIVTLFTNNELDFEDESGQKDDTLAHAIERFFGIICQVKKRSIVESPARYSNLTDTTLNEVAKLVLSQQYVGNDVFIKQKQQIYDYQGAINFKEKEVELLLAETASLKELAESMRIKNRIKEFFPPQLWNLLKMLIKAPKKIASIIKVIIKNPSILKKVFYYAKRGELKYLLAKIKEKSAGNLEESNNLVEVETKHYLKELDKSKYTLDNITVDIIIPVYNGYEFLEKLFDSIEKNTSSAHRLIVINDCSPDEKVKPYLIERLKKHPTAVFIDHSENQGFLKSVNEAYTYTSNHFLILNTDTEVPELWMERLMYPIVHMDNIASTTPFTNSGEIASFPNFIADNNIFDGMSVDELDVVFRDVNAENFYSEVPTGVGFCMGVNYNLTKEIGLFVEDTFGKGYGEENDWCQRAIAEGYKNLIVPNLFVYHKHGGSFSTEEKENLLKENIVKLQERHPNYGKDVQEYIQENPHNVLRQLLVILASNKQKSLSLIFDHDLGGGANIYTDSIIEERIENEENTLLVKYDYYSSVFKLTHFYKEYKFTFKITSIEELKSFIEKLDTEEIFVNNLVSYKEIFEILELILELSKDKNTKLIVPIHDYYTLSPSYNLLNEEGKYNLQECLSNEHMNNNMQEWRTLYSNDIDMPKWKSTWGKIFERSNEILCFSNSSKNIFLEVYSDIDENKIKVESHKVKKLEPLLLEKSSNKTTVTVGVLGAIDFVKGANIIKQMIQVIERDSLDIDIVVIGEITEIINSKHFKVTGRYTRDELPNFIKENDIDIFLIPSICPETFSYTTQEIMMMDMPLMVFNIGAPAERVVNYSKGYIVNKVSSEAVLETIKQFQSNKVH